MANEDFLDKFFLDYWTSIDRSMTTTDEHSMFGDAEVFQALIESIQPQSIIEVGSWKGHSANHMADVCRAAHLQCKIICIDTFLGAVEHWVLPGAFETLRVKNGRPTVFECFLGNTFARKNTEYLLPLTMDSANAAQVLQHYQYKADLIFIDAAHDYDDVIADIEGYLPLLSERGVIFGDDYQYEPLARAVHDMANRLSLQVLVAKRKWMFVNPRRPLDLSAKGFEPRTSYEGWVHP